jgi:hypothetical protein
VIILLLLPYPEFLYSCQWVPLHYSYRCSSPHLFCSSLPSLPKTKENSQFPSLSATFRLVCHASLSRRTFTSPHVICLSISVNSWQHGVSMVVSYFISIAGMMQATTSPSISFSHSVTPVASHSQSQAARPGKADVGLVHSRTSSATVPAQRRLPTYHRPV